MRELINEKVLCVLRKNEMTSQIEIDYVNIENPLQNTLNIFFNLCDTNDSTLDQILIFIKASNELNQLTTYYRYCNFINGSYQAFSGNHKKTIEEITNRQQLILLNQRENPDYDIKGAISSFKQELKAKYMLWGKAFAINKTYRLCHEDKSILTFSHRIDGWSNPEYQLTSNFSLEIKTNFGYGRASYFYTKLKYKNIEITPFSEWIEYEFALFSEIVRYTRSHFLTNQHWFEAMNFSKDACNLSMTDEVKFVEKYIIDECEIMVRGLERIFDEKHFSFKDRENRTYRKNKEGHVLIEFRGEKISGALDFISKILEFKRITSIKSFIERIEDCNKKIQPILVAESEIINVKILNLSKERDELKPIYDATLEENKVYEKMKLDLQIEMLLKKQLDPKTIDLIKLNNEFNSRNPEYLEFKKEYNRVIGMYQVLIQQIHNFTFVREKILRYNKKITHYFEK